MKIALDFDDTFTRDPELWKAFVQNAQSRGHEVRIVTYRFARHENFDLWAALRGTDISVMFTNSERKRDHCARCGYFPDVWIDDLPELIVADNTYIPGEMLARQLGSDDGKI